MNTRRAEILEQLRQQGRLEVDVMAAHFGVTLQTIRRDFTELAEEGRLERVHGGAVRPSGTVNIAYQERRDLNASAKAAIARDAAALIPNGATLFLNIGTTTEAVAQALGGHRGLLIVTNNMTVADILRTNADCDVVLTGGNLRRADGGLTGPLAARSVADFRLDMAVIGCSALSPGGDLLDFDASEVMVSQAMLAQSRAHILVADHSKFQRTAPWRIAGLDQIGHFVTDAPIDPDLADDARLQGTSIRVAGGR